MKWIKSYRVFESGIKSETFQDITVELKDILTHHFQPHIQQEDGNRNMFVSVMGNQSKWGTIYDVSFLVDYPVYYKDLNDDFKQLNFMIEICDIIKEKSGFSQVSLVSFNYFGYEAKGRKDGHKMTIEDVSNKLDDVITQCLDTEPVCADTTVIKLSLLCK